MKKKNFYENKQFRNNSVSIYDWKDNFIKNKTTQHNALTLFQLEKSIRAIELEKKEYVNGFIFFLTKNYDLKISNLMNIYKSKPFYTFLCFSDSLIDACGKKMILFNKNIKKINNDNFIEIYERIFFSELKLVESKISKNLIKKSLLTEKYINYKNDESFTESSLGAFLNSRTYSTYNSRIYDWTYIMNRI